MLIGEPSKNNDFKTSIQSICQAGVLDENSELEDVIGNFINASKEILEKLIDEAGNTKSCLYIENVERDSAQSASAQTKMTLSVKLQFFLAQINVYCINAKIVGKDVDFGKILDRDQQLRDQLLDLIFAGDVFKYGRVEKVIFDFFKNKKDLFSLSQELSEKDEQAIKEQFNQDYLTIKDSQHFDNFWLLRSQAQGKAFATSANICVDFAWLTSELKTATLSPSLQVGDQYSPITCSANSLRLANIKESQTKQVTLDEEALFEDIKNLLNQKTKESLKRALNLLKIKVGNQYFFELKKQELTRILSSSENTAIKKALLLLANKEFIGDKDILGSFIETFEENKKQLILTKNKLRALYVGIESQILEHDQISGYESCEDILKILQYYGLNELAAKDIAISSSQSAYILVDKSTFDDKHNLLRGVIETNKNKFYLESNRTGKMEKDSDPYKIYEKAGQNMSPPASNAQTFFNSYGALPDLDRIKKALELCHIHINENEIKNDDYKKGYYLELSKYQILQVEEILYPPIILSQKTSGLLYQLVNKFCSPTVTQSMNSLNNAVNPQKMKFALEALGINFFGDINFNSNNGFIIRVTKEVDDFFKELDKIEVDPPFGIVQYVRSFQSNSGKIKSEYKKLIPNLKGLQEKLLFSDIKHEEYTTDELNQIGYSEKIIIEPSIKIETLQSARYIPGKIPKEILSSDEEKIKIYCPDRILQAFKELLRNKDKILGKKIKNPYNQTDIIIPKNPDELTAFHLHILARNESVNCDGIMKLELYDGLLDDNEIAQLRCLVKATNLVSVASARSYGGYTGYPNPDNIKNLDQSQKVIIIDQSGLQWQGDHRNTGGLFFYPTNPNDDNLSGGNPVEYKKWQSDMFKAMYQRKRPDECSTNSIEVTWKGVKGKVDLGQLALGIKEEFLQAFASAINSSDLAGRDEKIYFKFLKAGMGFFAEGIGVEYHPVIREAICNARLEGICDALLELSARIPKGIAPEEKTEIAKKIFKKVEVIELPFSGDDGSQQLRDKIKTLVIDLGLKYQDPTENDALKRHQNYKDYIIATTNTGDPHAFAGNEGYYNSVDAAISCNLENPNCLNPLINNNFQENANQITIRSNQDCSGEVNLKEEIKDQFKILTPIQNFQGIEYEDDRFSFASIDKAKDNREFSSLITAGLSTAKENLSSNEDNPPPAKFFLAVMQIASYNRGIGSMKETDLQSQLRELLGDLYQDNYPQLAREFSAKFQQANESKILTGRQTEVRINNTAMRLFRASTDQNIKIFFNSIATAEEKENFSELLQNNYKKLSKFNPSKKLAVSVHSATLLRELSSKRSVSPP